MQVAEGLEKIIPKWTQKIQKRETFEELQAPCKIDGQILSINNYRCCMVGEAHQFNAEYDSQEDRSGRFVECVECARFSMEFFHIIKNEGYTEKEFILAQQEFIDHWNEEHAEVN